MEERKRSIVRKGMNFVLAASTYIGLSLSEKRYEQNPR